MAEPEEDAMTNQHKGFDQTRDPRTTRPPLPGDTEKAKKRKTKIEREENEDLEVDEGTEATKGSPESPDNTGAERKMVNREGEFDDWRDYDEADPDAVEEEMRNQDS
jgi:hypothetical protein